MSTSNSSYQKSSSSKKRAESSAQLPSVGELERGLSQDIQASYRRLLGSQPQRVICHLFGNCIGIVIEQSVTALEKLLAGQDGDGLVRQVRQKVDDAFREEIFRLVKQRMGVEAKSVLLETSLDSGTTGSLVVLVSLPKVRNVASIPKTDAYRRMSRSNGSEQSNGDEQSNGNSN